MSQWEKDLVFGYNKNAQTLVTPNRIPMDVSYLCLVYYHEHDYFDKCDNRLEINEARDTVAVKNVSGDATFGKGQACGGCIINGKIPMIYSWTFETFGKDINHYLKYIGISSGTEPGKLFSEGADNTDIEFYRMENDGEVLCSLWSLDWEKYNEGFNDGDIVKMEINTKKQEIKYFVNDKDHGVAFRDINFDDKEFRMAVFIGDKDYKIRLSEFKRTILRKD